MLNCIDICSYNGAVDFAKLKKAGVRTVILRSIRKGLVADGSFEAFYKAATAQGLSVGVYLYSYATSKSYAKKEADALIKLLNGRPVPAGVWFDMEIPELRSATSETVQGIADAFRGKMKAADYRSGIYCDVDFYHAWKHFSGYDASCPFWIASYGANDGKQHAKPSINHKLWAWQYSDKGTVSGISGKCDVNEVYGSGKVNPLPCDLPTLRRGDRSYAVLAMQQRLNRFSAFIDEDGVFGADTEDNLKIIQRTHKLDADGVCGPLTWEVLMM